MQRYFVQDTFDDKNELTVTGESARHITKVMRMEVGDKIVAVVSQVAYICEIVNIGLDVMIRSTGVIVPSPEMPIRVDIACGLPKGDKLEFIAQKGTELGMNGLIPFKAERSIVKWDDKKGEKKTERLQKIAQEAAEQSHRTVVPNIASPISFKELLSIIQNYDAVFVADEEDAKGEIRTRFADKLKKVYDNESKSILLVFGPEGGISRIEAESLIKAGAETMSLGPRILRAETAPVYALSAISYEFE
ncbi:16S rRNA methyltransferase [Ureibacillus massiliensis 4400831 = CIP 108448 = CCUG 49529]|uniref:Ribosomal RNA small subunit methyltransferase E n=1 Tax=Ureibacillus massiliensis 4400831 = CIP 108448 = CCUG 49529 TaxID=1211035 RepID=A0A0A3J6B4_9BACL|nr:16S rRNA (uracil(1498)-N(3))-methyltransferase [Ureibacillus massiliensis]KGR90703.1 16S rRNA methyltransferase [Ureibacillus massiliensis 4400831 = CIP 108448 = CCUG 49529]